MASHPKNPDICFELPTAPVALLKLSGLLGHATLRVDRLAELVESDMALAAALLKTVNSSLFNLSGSIQSVRQAITFLGVREVAGLTLQAGLRAAFPASSTLDAIWKRAARRARLMEHIGTALNVAPWDCHSAGLFQECGKAVLFRHAPARYGALLAAVADDDALSLLELPAFGVSHEIAGAALCETWGLSQASVDCVRQHVHVHATLRLPQSQASRPLCAVSALVHVAMHVPHELDAACSTIGAQLGCGPEVLLALVKMPVGESPAFAT